MSLGESIVTADGIKALALASASGSTIKPRYFKFSSQNLNVDPELDKNDISGWIQKDIGLYNLINNTTIEFVCDVMPDEATHYAKFCGIYLDDGTLFMVAKPPYPFPPGLRQTFKIQMVYQNATGLVDFQYLPWDEQEQSLSILDTSVSLGIETMANSEDIGLLKQKIGVK